MRGLRGDGNRRMRVRQHCMRRLRAHMQRMRFADVRGLRILLRALRAQPVRGLRVPVPHVRRPPVLGLQEYCEQCDERYCPYCYERHACANTQDPCYRDPYEGRPVREPFTFGLEIEVDGNHDTDMLRNHRLIAGWCPDGSLHHDAPSNTRANP